MNAHPSEQQTLLRIQALDTRLVQLAHQRSHIEEDAQIAALELADEAIARDRAVAQGALDDARSDLSRVEADVEVVQARIARDTERESQSSSAKDVAALESELQSLRVRLSTLESTELDVMQRVEDAEREISAINSRAQERADARSALEASKATTVEGITRDVDAVQADRRAIAATVDGTLLEMYEQRRARTGVGAGLLRQKTCGACSMALTGSDFEKVRQLAADSVAFCPECDAILVRTEESGLA